MKEKIFVFIIIILVGTVLFVRLTEKKATTDNNLFSSQPIPNGDKNSANNSSKLITDMGEYKQPITSLEEGGIYKNDLLEYEVLYPSNCLITETSIRVDAGSNLKDFETSFKDKYDKFEVIVYSSKVSHAAYEWNGISTVGERVIVINGKKTTKLIVKDERNTITHIVLFHLPSTSFNHWIEVNFLQSPSNRDLEKVQSFITSFKTF